MDLNSLIEKSPKVMQVVQAMKDDPNFLTELQESPKEALKKIGVELNKDELNLVQKIANLGEIKEGVSGLFNSIKGLFGYK